MMNLHKTATLSYIAPYFRNMRYRQLFANLKFVPFTSYYDVNVSGKYVSATSYRDSFSNQHKPIEMVLKLKKITAIQ